MVLTIASSLVCASITYVSHDVCEGHEHESMLDHAQDLIKSARQEDHHVD